MKTWIERLGVGRKLMAVALVSALMGLIPAVLYLRLALADQPPPLLGRGQLRRLRRLVRQRPVDKAAVRRSLRAPGVLAVVHNDRLGSDLLCARFLLAPNNATQMLVRLTGGSPGGVAPLPEGAGPGGGG